MSKETMEALNTQTLIGFTEKRGNAWHYREDLQGEEPNHYVGAIPVEDVHRRLFHWEAIEGSVSAQVITMDGVQTFHDTTRKAIVRPDTGEICSTMAPCKSARPRHRPGRKRPGAAGA